MSGNQLNLVPVIVTLNDKDDNQLAILYYYNKDDKLLERPSTGVDNLTSEIAYAHINDITIDGNGWRDIDAGGYLDNFVSEVLLGDRDGDEFLTNISEALGTSDDPGYLL